MKKKLKKLIKLIAGFILISMKKLTLILLIIPIISFSQNNLKPGQTDFNSNDKIAIKEVIDAYGFYWDSNDLDGYLSLFIEKAIGVTINSKGEMDKYYIKSDEQVENSKKRMEFFKENQMQRRHMMANTLFLELSESYAHIRQYMTLMTTNKKETTEILTPIDYISCFRDCNYCVKTLIEKVHFNKDKHENMNIYISSIKGNYIMVYK